MLTVIGGYNIALRTDMTKLKTLDEHVTAMYAAHLTWKSLVYFAMYAARLEIAELRSEGDTMTLDNPMNSYLFWFLSENTILYCIQKYGFCFNDLSTLPATPGAESPYQAACATSRTQFGLIKDHCEAKKLRTPELFEI